MANYGKITANYNKFKEFKTMSQQTTENYSKLLLMIVIVAMTWIGIYLYW